MLNVFSQCPWVLDTFEMYTKEGVHNIKIKGEVLVPGSGQSARKETVLNETGYATAALASYEEFKKAREEGIIKKGVKFQVSLPMPYEIPAFCILPKYQAQIEALYEEKIIEDLLAIQNTIPANDLAI
jgi:hypothetical protein